MGAISGLRIIENCLSCRLRTEHFFCDLSPEALRSFEAISSTAVYPKGVMLFVEGQEPRGVFVLCAGRVKLSTSSGDGKTVIFSWRRNSLFDPERRFNDALSSSKKRLPAVEDDYNIL